MSPGCCALGTCSDPNCRLCTVTAKLPQPTTKLIQQETAKYAVPDPKLKKEAKHPMFKKRHRVGPHR